MEYIFIKSRRKTIGISVKKDGTVVLRAPLFCSRKRAEEFLLEKADWVEQTRKRVLENRNLSGTAIPFSKEELANIKKQAKRIIPPLVEETAGKMGTDYGRISLRFQKSRWGSCSGKKNLNFNCLLVLLPENLQRYVVVHELCHLKEMNHWAEVAGYCPTWKADRKQLKTEGEALISRL